MHHEKKQESVPILQIKLSETIPEKQKRYKTYKKKANVSPSASVIILNVNELNYSRKDEDWSNGQKINIIQLYSVRNILYLKKQRYGK